ncbi:MAG: magnesium-translocating P-type ATPase [Oscillospiraceae bacterium]|nr:magnesium-translocating P-type ATPase [Oscillospiraceae bacterium]
MQQVIKKPQSAAGNRNTLRETRLRRWAQEAPDQLYQDLQTTAHGLSHETAEERLEEQGPNRIVSGQKHGRLMRLFDAIINPFNIVLIIIALVTFLTDVVFSASPDYLTTVIILGLVLLSSLVSFVQGERSNNAAAKLSAMISNKADVLRSGSTRSVSLEELVPGDVVVLSAGDIIPADVRFLSTRDAFISQASLTGESSPVEKKAADPGQDLTGAALTDISCLGFMGSNMVSGKAQALVLCTGNDTYIGGMSRQLENLKTKNSFEKGVASVSSLLLKMMLVMMPLIFLINGLTKHDWLDALLFAITVAVGLTPEMLPVVMSSTLARGAVNMSKDHVIVKNMGSIQSFGQMDVLCTDKTGTLTEDKVVLEKYMDIHGKDNLRVLRHAYMNSYFQTGLKNLIDLAIINHAEKDGLDQECTRFSKIDEIPFDFERRRMSVVLQDQTGKRQLVTKGAVEEMLSICSFVEDQGQVVALDDNLRRLAKATYNRFNAGGLRVLAVAQKNEMPEAEVFSVADEKDLVLLGFIGFLDPPKESAIPAVKALGEHGVRMVVLTGDSVGVAARVCQKIGIPAAHSFSGDEVMRMSDERLALVVENCNLFAKLAPADKQRIVAALQKKGHTVGYMGDGINDALALRQADVGISVDSAVDIAKETADIILLRKDLMVLEKGVIAGRRTFANIMKYIKMAVSGNFSNMISLLLASFLLPFLPMLPVQILAQNLLCDLAQMGIPFDRVDDSYVKTPHRWDTASIKRFMAYMGPLGSVFDMLCFLTAWFILGADNQAAAPLFHSAWFTYGTVSQIVIVLVIRTSSHPWKANSSRPAGATLLMMGIVTASVLTIGFTPLSVALDMTALPLIFLGLLLGLLLLYAGSLELVKTYFIRRFGEWL